MCRAPNYQPAAHVKVSKFGAPAILGFSLQVGKPEYRMAKLILCKIISSTYVITVYVVVGTSINQMLCAQPQCENMYMWGV